MDLKSLLSILSKNVDEKALIKDLSVFILIPFLEQVVADTENNFDNLALEEIKKFIEKL